MQIKPAFNVIVGVEEEVLILNVIFACAEVLDLGTYPIFLAYETTFSRTDAESKKDSLITILELNAVM